jgi:hypothetical protein
MKGIHRLRFMLPVCAVLLASGTAMATPRMDVPPPEPDTPEKKEARRLQAAADMPAWMPRLVGRFKYNGIVQFFQASTPGAEVTEVPSKQKFYSEGTCDEECYSSIPSLREAKGMGDCIAIGSGPGVQCVINVVWQEEWTPKGQAVEGGVSFLGPAATIYGFDPMASKIRYLILNTKGIAESETGVLKGDTLSWIFDTHCESSGMNRCRQVTRVAALPDGNTIRTSIDIEKWDLRDLRWWRLTTFSLDMHRVQQGPQDKALKAPAPAAKRKR